ncbi:hypothetical protein [Candidatus Entotheonella palauensis]|uniref:hypothetical protein n=1 Tax=Candidatus Entotheonella palauensis TaxID=93172 RepID=UPI000B7F6F5A|nr:hypothetical protein [Candidatus Entotheonella palauensis]
MLQQGPGGLIDQWFATLYIASRLVQRPDDTTGKSGAKAHLNRDQLIDGIRNNFGHGQSPFALSRF